MSTILVVDDELGIRALLSEILGDEGHAVEVAENAALVAAWPGVVEAAGLIGSTQIQGRATVAGNLCNASPAADSVPAMVAAGAVARLASAHGTRDVAVEDIPAGLQAGERTKRE